MNIGNITQFVSFIKANGLENLDVSFSQVIRCLGNYDAACNCYKREDKLKMYEDCNKTYRNTITGVVPRFKHQFLSKTGERQISISDDRGQTILILSR